MQSQSQAASRKASYASTMSFMSDMEESVPVKATTVTRVKAVFVMVAGRKTQTSSQAAKTSSDKQNKAPKT